jgi:PAS domain S-box-containing protein
MRTMTRSRSLDENAFGPRDVTERRGAEEELRQSEERFHLLVQSVQDYAIFMLTPEGNVTSWNAGAERMKGYTSSEIIGRHFSVFYPADVVAAGKPDWELRTALEHGRVEDEGWRVRKDGSRFWANVIITALHGKNGRHVGFAKVTRDLTERRKIEALEEASRQKDQFVAVLAHELRNPLAPIRSALHVLEHPEVTADTAARALEIAQRQVRHMARLLEDLLDVARLSEGKMSLRRDKVDVASITRAAVESTQPLLRERGHQVTVETPSEPLWIHADPARIEQVLTNLLTNAAKYTNLGGRIRVTVRSEEDNAVVRVLDSGIGIEPVMLPRIFDLFVQGERRVDRAAGGVGIGLTLVKKLVQLHGGTVNAFSPGLEMGSEFVVRLPAMEALAPAPGPRSEGTSVPGEKRPLRILVVDDNADAADGMAMIFEMGGDLVRVAYDGQAALAVAGEFRPEVVLLDIGMPGLDGYEVARRLRRDPETRDAILIAMTGWGQPHDRLRSAQAGFHRHIVKPVEPAEVERHLDEIRSRLET